MKTGLFGVLESNYCKLVFIISLVITSFIVPKRVFHSYYTIIGILFILITAILMTCFIRGMKEKVNSAKANGASFIGILGIIFGFGALQACTIGAPVCGASIGGGILALLFPGFALGLLEKYSIWIIIISIFIQILALYFMRCLNISFKGGKNENSNSI